MECHYLSTRLLYTKTIKMDEDAQWYTTSAAQYTLLQPLWEVVNTKRNSKVEVI